MVNHIARHHGEDAPRPRLPGVRRQPRTPPIHVQASAKRYSTTRAQTAIATPRSTGSGSPTRPAKPANHPRTGADRTRQKADRTRMDGSPTTHAGPMYPYRRPYSDRRKAPAQRTHANRLTLTADHLSSLPREFGSSPLTPPKTARCRLPGSGQTRPHPGRQQAVFQCLRLLLSRSMRKSCASATASAAT